MITKTYSAEELAATRLARFKDLKPFPHAFVDTVIPEYERDIFSVIGDGVLEDPEMQPKIVGEHCFSPGIIRMEPGKGAGLHAHTTEEVFIPVKGKCTIFWGDDAENEPGASQSGEPVSMPRAGERAFLAPGYSALHQRVLYANVERTADSPHRLRAPEKRTLGGYLARVPYRLRA